MIVFLLSQQPPHYAETATITIKREDESNMQKLTDVNFYHTGGGCILYTARFNDEVWMATDFETVEYYDVPKEEADKDFDNGVPYEDHFKTPSVPLPTWGDVCESIREHVPSMVHQMELCVKDIDLSAPCVSLLS